MISIVAGSLASSVAYMLIPTTIKSKADLYVIGIRFGMTLTAPLVTVLLSAPKAVLEFIGPQYASSDIGLMVLSVGILPSAAVMLAISKFNNANLPKRIILIGIIQLVSFLTAFYVLVPTYGSLGAAFSITIGLVVSSIPAILWLEKYIVKFVINSMLAVLAGTLIAYSTCMIFHTAGVTQMTIGLIFTILTLFLLKNIYLKDILQLIPLRQNQTK